MKVQYLVKRAAIHAAERNPYRPRQKTKRGKWIRFGAFDDPQQAMNRGNQLCVGMYEVGIWWRGKRIASQNQYTGQLEWLCICTRNCDCQDESGGMVSNECPFHNTEPDPHPECLAKNHWFRKMIRDA